MQEPKFAPYPVYVARNIINRYVARSKKLPGIVHVRRRYQHERADYILVSYPKSGRTWLRAMFGRAIQQHYSLDPKYTMLTTELSRLDKRIPRIYSTHDDFAHNKEPDRVERNKRKYASKRVILLVRDPRDVIVSLFFQKKFRRRGKAAYNGELSSYLFETVGGIRSLIAFYNAWAESREVPQDLCVIKYEDILADPEKELRRMLGFLRIDWLADETITDAVQFGNFDNLKNVENANAVEHGSLKSSDPGNVEASKVRKGKAGGYVDYLNPFEIEKLNKIIQNELSDFFHFYK